ncbi:hypothetical protein B0H19DRAFT_1383396 [Mycena capillaripes]|nr:hypothetical protein B0H19DRAFT_1383396 [Mycena capillaripes]
MPHSPRMKSSACVPCRQRKLRCDGGSPCKPCSRARAKLSCEYIPRTSSQRRLELPKGGACTECRERKRKCDGKLPCITCSTAARPHLCEYRALPGHVYEPPPSTHRRRWKIAQNIPVSASEQIPCCSTRNSIKTATQDKRIPSISRRRRRSDNSRPTSTDSFCWGNPSSHPSPSQLPSSEFPPTEVTADSLRTLDDYFALFDFDGLALPPTSQTYTSPAPCEGQSWEDQLHLPDIWSSVSGSYADSSRSSVSHSDSSRSSVSYTHSSRSSVDFTCVD